MVVIHFCAFFAENERIARKSFLPRAVSVAQREPSYIVWATVVDVVDMEISTPG